MDNDCVSCTAAGDPCDLSRVEPEGIYLITTVDIADTGDVIAVVGDRLVELQVDEGLPVYVTPLRPIERVIAELRNRKTATPPASLPLT
jgi:hypothetical protein